jgi:hypothetical protein
VQLAWNQVANADGYEVWTQYGKNDATAAWDRLAVLDGANKTSFTVDALNVGKTFKYKVTTFNAAGSTDSAVQTVTTGAQDCPLNLPPEQLRVVAKSGTWIQLQWIDPYDCEEGYVVERQDVDAGGPIGPFYEVFRGQVGGEEPGLADVEVQYTDTGLKNKKTFNYRVAAYTGTTMSPYSIPVAATTGK